MYPFGFNFQFIPIHLAYIAGFFLQFDIRLATQYIGIPIGNDQARLDNRIRQTKETRGNPGALDIIL